MSTAANVQPPLKKGDKVAYYITRRVSHGSGIEQVRRTGIVQCWRDGKVVVLHKAGYTEHLNDADLYLVE
jgi:predicted RNA-binding protein with TRAM domain